MSFSDFSGGPSSGNSAKHYPAAPSSASGGGLQVISDTLLQYQRNVGILEGIVQMLPNSAAIEQYHAQNHVLHQLEEKVSTLLRQQPSQNTALVKLRRDFQRVQLRATQLQETATRMLSAQSTTASSTASSSAAADGIAPYQQQQQLQLMEDRLNEQIMREREEEIRNINQGMHTVNEIYKDLAHIVSGQQEQINQIETQMEDSRANADAGLQQVEKANEKFGNGQCTLM